MRPRKRTVLIVCEGKETEPNYFDGLKREEPIRERFTITVKGGKGGSRLQVAQFAVDRKNEPGADYDEVWCVMDVERPEGLDEMRKALALLGGNSISAGVSNPSFEVWLLAHFERTGAAFLDCDAVIVRLNKHWQERFSIRYDKADDRIYDRLAKLTRKAVDNARWVREKHHGSVPCIVDCNSATDVYRLVARLHSAAD
jgi:hypothetical protein